MEKRYHDFGRYVRAEDQNNVQNFMFQGGVLKGMSLSVSSDGLFIEIGPGEVITQNGVIVSNNQTRELEFTRTGDAKVYTLALVHTYSDVQGGRETTIELREMTSGGLPIFGDSAIDSDGNVEGVVLGWMNYPGGSVDPTDSMMFEAGKERILSPNLSPGLPYLEMDSLIPIERRPPFTQGPGLYIDEDSNVSSSHSLENGLPLTEWTNASGIGDENVTLILTPDRPAPYRPKAIIVDLDSPDSTDVEVFTIVDGTETSLGTKTGSFSGKQTFRVDDDLFPHSPQVSETSWGIKVVVTIPATETVGIRLIQAQAAPKPLEP